MIVDTHCHLYFEELEKDIDGVLSRANDLGVNIFICVGTNLSDSYESLTLAQKYKSIYATAGIHPHDSKDAGENWTRLSLGSKLPGDPYLINTQGKDIAELAHKYDSLIVADTVTSLGGVDLQIDNWNIDLSYSVTQKCLGCPPGLAPVTVNQASIEKIERRAVPPNTWYYDLLLLQKTYWGAEQRTYHHTAPITMIYGLREGLRLLVEEGIEERIQIRTKTCSQPEHNLTEKIRHASGRANR